ncbi:hypothetical protein Tcan_15290 [Toxocara canis]|uniref:Uncharacterized protein n=1 Tax=Toxocara canis TaxID=6265 RepID=A0A0B2VM76_TOXCA|nr:hypothetical protein Tcan_15290 [Toxocara canis]
MLSPENSADIRSCGAVTYYGPSTHHFEQLFITNQNHSNTFIKQVVACVRYEFTSQHVVNDRKNKGGEVKDGAIKEEVLVRFAPLLIPCVTQRDSRSICEMYSREMSAAAEMCRPLSKRCDNRYTKSTENRHRKGEDCCPAAKRHFMIVKILADEDKCDTKEKQMGKKN